MRDVAELKPGIKNIRELGKIALEVWGNEIGFIFKASREVKVTSSFLSMRVKSDILNSSVKC